MFANNILSSKQIKYFSFKMQWVCDLEALKI